MPPLVSVSALHRAMPLSMSIRGVLGMWPAIFSGGHVAAQQFDFAQHGPGRSAPKPASPGGVVRRVHHIPNHCGSSWNRRRRMTQRACLSPRILSAPATLSSTRRPRRLFTGSRRAAPVRTYTREFSKALPPNSLLSSSVLNLRAPRSATSTCREGASARRWGCACARRSRANICTS